MNVTLLSLLGGRIIQPNETKGQGIRIEFNIDGKNAEETKTIKDFIESEIKQDGYNEIIYSGPWPPENHQVFRIVGMKTENQCENKLQEIKQTFEESSRMRGKLISDFELRRLQRQLNKKSKILEGGIFVYTGEQEKPESEDDKKIYQELEKKVQEACERYHAIKDSFSEVKGAILIATTYWFIRCPNCGHEQGAYYDKPSGEIECKACRKKAPIVLEVEKRKCSLDAY